MVEHLNEENESLPNGKLFLDQGGIKLLLKCRKRFPLNTALGEALIKSLHQVSLVKELRPQLMSKKGMDPLLPMIFEFFEADVYSDVNHYASKTLANVLSEGKTAWSVVESYNDALYNLDKITTKWVKFEMKYDTFKTIYPLLESPQCQYFALWSLKVHTSQSCCKYQNN